MDMKLALCFLGDDNQVIAKQFISTEWNGVIEDYVFRGCWVDVSKELATLMKNEITEQITVASISDMLKEVQRKADIKV